MKFPSADMTLGKPRPILLLARIPGVYDDWLICMISSQLRQEVDGFDDIVHEDDEDFRQSGLKLASVIRLGRLAVVSSDVLRGSIGAISELRLQRLRQRLAQWILG